MTLPIVDETHQRGMLTIENWETIQEYQAEGFPGLMDCDVGIQTHCDGRIWLCVNGLAFIRFKPNDKAISP